MDFRKLLQELDTINEADSAGPDPVKVKRFLELVAKKNNKSVPSPRNITQDTSGLSQFSIKGFRFGMTLDQVQQIAHTSVTDKYPPYAWAQAFQNVTIGGLAGWYPTQKDGRLVSLFLKAKSEIIDDALETFSKVYGKPVINYKKSRTKGGVELDDYYAVWDVQDAVIEMGRHYDLLSGTIYIRSKKYKESQSKEYNNERSTATKDF